MFLEICHWVVQVFPYQHLQDQILRMSLGAMNSRASHPNVAWPWIEDDDDDGKIDDDEDDDDNDNHDDG